MDRKRFLEKLAYLLQDIEDVERDEALQYYEDYFDEAGAENETQLINDLGSPERVAAIIKAGLENRFDDDIEFSEKGMDNAYYKEASEIIEADVIDHENHHEKRKNNFKGNPERNRILIILILIGIVILGFSGLFGVGISALAVVLAVGIGILVGGVICLAGAIACFIRGLIILSATPGMGLIVISAGFALIALAVGFFVVEKALIKAVPLVINGGINLVKTIINKVGELIWKNQPW